MPKQKTHKGTVKRIKLTGSGKAMRRHAFSNHNLTKKDKDRKRAYAIPQRIRGKAKATVKRMMGV